MAVGGQLKMEEGTAGGTHVGFKAPDTEIATEVIWELPDADGTSGQVLMTNSLGKLSWTSQAAGATGDTGDTGATGATGAAAAGLNKYTGKITSITAGYTVDSISFCIPYQLQDGSWMLKFWANISGNGGTNLLSLRIPGTTMLGTFACTANDQTSPCVCYATDAYPTMQVAIETYGTAMFMNVSIYGEIPLTSKPSWAS